MSTDVDPEVHDLREQLTANDVRIVEAVNARIALVQQLKRVKQERGLGFVDAAREEWLVEHLAAANTGPLSDDGVREFVTRLLDLTKREVYSDGV